MRAKNTQTQPLRSLFSHFHLLLNRDKECTILSYIHTYIASLLLCYRELTALTDIQANLVFGKAGQRKQDWFKAVPIRKGSYLC